MQEMEGGEAPTALEDLGEHQQPIWETEDWYGLLLWCVEGIGSARYRLLVERLGGARQAVSAGPQECARLLGTPWLFDNFQRSWPVESCQEQLVGQLEKGQITVLKLGWHRFPALLQALGEPEWLFVRGDPAALQLPLAAIVGTRAARMEGIRWAQRVVGWCVQRGWHTVSGGALGVDGAVHRATIDRKATTVVVMPAGLLHLAPRSQRSLFEAVVDHGGCLVSEHPPCRTPRSQLFVRRNRLISGLAAFTVVIRAPLHSGALITAAWARRQERPVYAVPGSPEDLTTLGCLEVIRSGGHLIASAEDLPRRWESVGRVESTPAAKGDTEEPRLAELPIGKEQRALMEILRSGPCSLEELVAELGKDLGTITTAVTQLVLWGHIRQIGPALYSAAGCSRRYPRSP
ncbi:MAG: DNA-protecting protein DprA [Bradymonadales bacterium]|nr:DNA-protecting protein DprA [Bradymonadales bacterium]